MPAQKEENPFLDIFEEAPWSNDALWQDYWGEADGYARIISDLANLLLNANYSRTVLIDGAYGTGKTSFCRALQRCLHERSKASEKNIRCLWLSLPTLVSHIHSSPLAAIMVAMVERLYEEDSLRNSAENDSMNLREALQDLWDIEAGPSHKKRDASAPDGSATMEPLLQTMAGSEFGSARTHRANTLETSIDKVLGWKELFECDDSMQVHSKKSDRRVPEIRLFVFLDDMDRCEKKVAPDIIRLLLRFGSVRGVHFILPSDRTILEYGVEEWMKENGMMDDGHSPLVTPNSALEKYLHHAVKLPGLGDRIPSGRKKSVEASSSLVRKETEELSPLPSKKTGGKDEPQKDDAHIGKKNRADNLKHIRRVISKASADDPPILADAWITQQIFERLDQPPNTIKKALF